MDRRIFMIYRKNPKETTLQLLEAADAQARIPKGLSVALKPNLVVAKHPDEGATTHAGILEGVIVYLREYGFHDISVIESSWVGDDTGRAFRACGYDLLSRKYGVPLYDLKRDKYRKADTAIGSMLISERALDADYMINLPVLKGHCQTLMTCALKNCKGCLPDSEKRRFHTLGLHKPIAALAAVLKPSLTIVDNICGDPDFEEGGNPVQTNRIFLGEDPVQIDILGCRLMGIESDKVPYIGLAEAYGAGSRELRDEDVISINQPDKANWDARPSGLAARLTQNVRADMACSACYGNLVHALHRMEKDGTACRKAIFIGQGFKGKKIDGIGIGRCCDGADIQIKGCPPSAESIMRILREI